MRQIVLMILVAVGAGLLGYVGGQYWQIYWSQRQLESQWEQQAWNIHANVGGGHAEVGASRHTSVFNSGSHSQQRILGRILISTIRLDAIVLEGSSPRDLSVAPGHLEDTAIPGEDGNVVITAHRDTFFRHIFELKPGDEIQIWKDDRRFLYRVTSKKVVKPDDLSVIAPTSDAELTLITCYPPHYVGPAPERLVVFSRLVP